MRRGERVTVQGPVKKRQPDGMSHRGLRVGGGGVVWFSPNFGDRAGTLSALGYGGGGVLSLVDRQTLFMG